MYCISNADCESLIETNVCKETVAGGAKTCQASTTCTQVCSSGEFCDHANICQYGKSMILLKSIINHLSSFKSFALSHLTVQQ